MWAGNTEISNRSFDVNGLKIFIDCVGVYLFGTKNKLIRK